MRSSALTHTSRHVRIDVPGATLDGDLVIPAPAGGLVLFAHGSGSGRLSPRNRHVAQALQAAGLGTLLLDLLTPVEEASDARTGRLRFDINLLAERLVAATNWLRNQPDTASLEAGYFGASTGGGAALVAATEQPDRVHAVVSRGGRPDLAGAALAHVKAPTLLIVGARDTPVIEMNRDAMRHMSSEVRLEIVPGATHLFEEPGALDEVARLAAEWFATYLGTSAVSSSARHRRAAESQRARTILNPTEEDLSVLPTGERRP